MSMHRIFPCSFLLVVLTHLLASQSVSAANDNVIAHALYKDQRFAEAAEIFTDPAWKGISLYRSSQWWRAAEAFVRADDADSIFNLGNCYVQLGYYELALDAYLGAIAKKPGFADAQTNADIMRQLLASNDDGKTTGSLQPDTEEIERLDSEAENQSSGDSENGAPSEETPTSQSGTDEGAEPDNNSGAPDPDSEQGSNETGNNENPGFDMPKQAGNVRGIEAEPTEEQSPAGGSESAENDSDNISAGMRSRLEVEQATTQWLNQISNSPHEYLKAQIRLETRRRRAAGNTTPAGGSQW